MHHTAQLIHTKLDVFVSNLILYSIDITWGRTDVLNLHAICTAIQYPLYCFLTTANYALVYHLSYECQQIEFFLFGIFVVLVYQLIYHLNNHKPRHLDDLGYNEGIFVGTTPSLRLDCQDGHGTQHGQLIFMSSTFTRQQRNTKSQACGF